MPTLLILLVSLSASQAPETKTPETVIADDATFAGLWQTSFGRMRLESVGDAVNGSYALDGGSTIRGTLEGGKLVFEYAEKRTRGEGWFELSDDGRSFAGQWRAEGSERWRGWRGTRIDPRPGRVWLIILEANWEQSLVEREYAFGDMLRSYFTMERARHVDVRHRFFHDLEDFRRFSREIAYVAEPVVLLVSTHGTEKGVLVGGNVISPEEIAASIPPADIKLLHLSGCSMMQGEVPRRIHDALPPERRFPVSGYSTVVAWDASALGDFTFLSMLLIRKLDPREAVRQTHLAAPFTGHDRVDGSVFAPLGLSVRMPDGT